MESELRTIAAPYFIKRMNDIISPCLAAFSDTMTFAAAPIMVILPPRHAPSDRHHQSGNAYSAPIVFLISTIMGAIVAVYGMLSMIPEIMPDAHNIIMAVADCEPFVAFKTSSAISFIPPEARTADNNEKSIKKWFSIRLPLNISWVFKNQKNARAEQCDYAGFEFDDIVEYETENDEEQNGKRTYHQAFIDDR